MELNTRSLDVQFFRTVRPCACMDGGYSAHSLETNALVAGKSSKSLDTEFSTSLANECTWGLTVAGCICIRELDENWVADGPMYTCLCKGVLQ